MNHKRFTSFGMAMIIFMLYWTGIDAMHALAQTPKDSIIAYVSSKTLCLASVETAESRCFEDPSIRAMYYPAWSPDGQRLAFMGSVGETLQSTVITLHVLDVNSWQAVRVSGEFPVSNFAWSAESDALYFASRLNEAQIGLYRVEIPSGLPLLITPLDAPGGILMAFAPDGKQVLITRRFSAENAATHQDDLFAYDLGTGELRQITNDRTTQYGIGFSPDGQQILLGRLLNHMDSADILVINNDGTGQKKVGTINFAQYSITHISWNPDGNSVLYDNEGRLFVYELSTGVTRQLGPGKWWRTYPVWSPDGHQIAFCQYTNPGLGLFVMDADAGNAKLIAANNKCLGLSWRP